MTMTRKSFLTHSAAAAAGAFMLSGKDAIAAESAPKKGPAAPAADAKAPAGPPPPSAIHFQVLKPGEFDDKKFWEIIKTKKEHKVIYDSVEPHLIVPGLSSLYIHMQNSLNAGEISFGYGKGNMACAAVLIGPSIAFALNDAMWAKYGFGAAFKLHDAKDKPETGNVYYKAQTAMSTDGDYGAGGNIYQDWSGEALIKRGATMMVCHNAMTGIAGMMAGAGDPKAVLAEFKANMLPGYMLVPAGVGALHAAMENGWKMLPLI